MLLIRVPTIISVAMVVSYTRARKRKKRKNHLTVATFILSYKDGGQFIHGERGNGGSKNFTGIYSWHWRDGERGSGPDSRYPRVGL